MKTLLSSRGIVVASCVALSFVVAVSAPVSTVNAQSALLTSVTNLKTQIVTAIESNLTKLKESSNSLSLNLSASSEGITGNIVALGGSSSGSISSTGVSGTVTTFNGSTASGSASKTNGASATVSTASGANASATINKDGASGTATGPKDSKATINIADGTIDGSITISPELIENLKEANQKAIDKLTAIKEKIESQSQLADVQATVTEYKQQVKEFVTANAQAVITKSIASATAALDRSQVVANNLQTRINKLKQCLQSATAEVNANAGNGSASASVGASAPGCTDLNVDLHSGDTAAGVQEKIDQIKSSVQTVKVLLSSVILIVSQLKDNAANAIASFEGVTGQLDIVADMELHVQNDLANLSLSVNKNS